MLDSGLPALIALIEFGAIIWLILRTRNDRRKIMELTLRARRAELREGPPSEAVERLIISGEYRKDIKPKGEK